MDTRTETPREPHPFRHNMKKWRKIKGMSQDDLARKITENPPDSLIFHQQTIQKIENGNRGVSLTDAVVISAALDVDLNTMLMRPDAPGKTSVDLRKERLRRDMHVAHLAVKELESTLKKLEEVYDIAPGEEERESVDKEIGRNHRHESPVRRVLDEYEQEVTDEAYQQMTQSRVDHGVDN